MLRRARTFPSCTLIVALLSALIALGVSPPRVAAAGGLNVPLEVKNRLAIARRSEPVTSGVPIPASAGITSVADLNILDGGGAAVPSQFSVTARWGGAPDNASKPVKWVLVTFLADVSASGSATYHFTSGTPNTTNSNLRVTANDSNQVVVNTGAAEFKVSKLKGTFLERVKVGSTTVTDSAQNGIVMTGQGGGTSASYDVKPRSVTVVEQGPMRVGVKIVGNLGSTVAAQSDYETYLYFYPDKTYVRALHSQVNHDTLKLVDGSWKPYNYYEPGSVTFTSLDIRQSLSSPSGVVTYYAPFGGGDSQGAVNDLSVLQDSSGTDYWDNYNDTPYTIGSDNFPNGDHPRPNSYQGFRGYRVTNNGSQVDAGNQYAGWFDVSDSAKGMTTGVVDFWQNFPKGFGATSSGLASVDLWPEDPNYHDGYNMRVGDKKTHNLYFYFHAGSGPASKADEVSEVLADPMMALAPTAWFSSTGAVTEFTAPTETLEDRLGKYHTGQLDDEQAYDYYNDRTLKEDSSTPYWSTHPCMSLVEGDAHPASRDYFNTYGWSFYGNEPLEEESYGDGKCAFFDHKYDFDFGAWMQFLRTRDYRWKDLALSMSRHQDMLMLNDVELENGWDPAEWKNAVFGHCMHVERGCDNGVRNYNSPTPQFAWGARGAELSYYLTGYEPSGEFAAKLADYMYNIWQFRTMTPGFYEGGDYGESGGVREPATTLNVLVEGWKLTGDLKYQQLAQQLMDIYDPDDQSYINGPVPGSGDRNIPVGFFAHYLCAMARYAQVAEEYGLNAEAQTARQRLKKFVDFMVRYTTFTWNGYYTSHYRWLIDGSDSQDQGEVNNWSLVCADACAYVYGFTGESAYLDRAQDYFHTGVNSPYCGDLATKLFYTSTKEATNHAVHGNAYLYFEARAEGTPTVVSVTPNRGTVGSAVDVTDLAGSNFEAGASVKLTKTGQADIGAINVNVVSDAKITCDLDLAGAATGAWNVVVTNPDDQFVTLTNGFTVEAEPVPAKPSITSISPTSGRADSTVTINGKDFGGTRGSSYVTFNNTKASSYTSWSDTQIKVRVPLGAKSGLVTVTTGSGTSNGVYFKVTILSPNSTWYLAEGSSDWGFVTYVNIQNPNSFPVTARITYMTRSGPVEAGDMVLPALSQTVVNPANQVGATDMSTKVECLEGETIAVDRRMIWTGDGADSPEGHSSMGVTSPAQAWYLAEGSSDWGFETWVLVQNPNAGEVACTFTYMVEGSGPVSFEKSVPANSRVSFKMSDDVGTCDASIMVEADQPVIAERAMYRNSRREGHDSVGVTAPSTDYYLAEGTTGSGFTTFVLVQNPNEVEATVTLTYMTPGGAKEQGAFIMPAQSRRTLRANDQLKESDCSIKVHSDVPIVAERAMYWDSGAGEACHDSVGIDSPHTAFYLPDGETGNGYETWVLVQNPNLEEIGIEVTYMTPTGEGNVTFQDALPAYSRRSYSMGDHLTDTRASIAVRSTSSGKKIIVERAMYWNDRRAGMETVGGFED